MTAEDLLKAADLKRVIPEAAAAPTAQLQSNEKEILSRQRKFFFLFCFFSETAGSSLAYWLSHRSRFLSLVYTVYATLIQKVPFVLKFFSSRIKQP